MTLSSVVRSMLAMAPLFVAGSVLAAPLTPDFKDIEGAKGPVRCEKGILKIAAHDGVYTRMAVDGLALKRFELDFKARQVAPSSKDHHYGVILKGDDGRKAMFFARESSLGCLTDKNGEGVTVGSINPPLNSGSTAEPNAFKIIVNGDFIEVNINQRLIGHYTYDLTPVRAIEFYSCNADIEVSNCQLRPMETEKPAAAPSTAAPRLAARFDGSTDAISGSGAPIKPVKAAGLSFVAGIKGQALRVSGTPVMANGKSENPILQYELNGILNRAQGAISFWFRPDWDGMANRDSHFMLTGRDGTGKEVFNLWFWEWIRADLPRTGGDGVSIERRIRDYVYKGDWMHVALVWSADGWVKLFVNGLPYRQGGGATETPARFASLDMGAIKSLCIGSGSDVPVERNAAGAFAELKLYGRAVSDNEVVADYRRYMPVDLLLDRAVVFAGDDERLELLVAPGGFYVRPQVGTLPPVKAKVALQVELAEVDSGKITLSKELSLDVQGPQKLVIPIGKLPEGAYRVTCTLVHDGVSLQKSFRLACYKPEPRQAASADDLKLGPPFFVKDFSKDGLDGVLHDGKVAITDSPLGKHLEVGSNNGDRAGFEIPFPAATLGKPTLLEIEWPDDQPRSMALYMYMKTTASQHRDRLGGGVQSGNEYPLTHTVQKTRYLFYPGEDHYLFEARTMISGFPAAVSKVSVYPIEGGVLPRLNIMYPDGMPHRTLGHLDEDQTFFIPFEVRGKPYLHSPMAFDKLAGYFDYTGQSCLSFALLRYGYPFYALEGQYGCMPMPDRPGEAQMIVELLNKKGISFIAIDNLWMIPELALSPDQKEEQTKRGYYVIKSNGAIAGACGMEKADFCHPDIRMMHLRHVRELCERYARLPGFDGLEVWLESFSPFSSLDMGYGDYTVALFSKETGVKVPETPADIYGGRYKFLTGPARASWLKWRADKTSAFLKALAETVHQVKPGLAIYVSIGGAGAFGNTQDDSAGKVENSLYENLAVNLTGLKAIPDLYPVPQRFPTHYRFEMFWGHPESTVDEGLYDFSNFTPFIKNGTAFSSSYPSYYETFKGSLKNAEYNGYFQNADIKPFGRYFLKEFVYSLAMMDAQRILNGSQPPGTWGRDAEIREFAKAYCALPALPFTEVAGLRDPVTVRYLNSKNGTYLYAANLLWSDCATDLKLPPGVTVKDLSTGVERQVTADGSFKIELKPYQLRSFLVNNGDVKVGKGAVLVPDATIAFYRQKLATLRAMTEAIAKTGGDVGKYRECLDRIQNDLNAGHYADAHRLVFSKRMNALPQLKQAAAAGFLKEQTKMIAESRYAVDCGSDAYYRAKSGTLFLPDQSFNNGNYGHDGHYNSVVHSTEKIKDTGDPILYHTEAYDIDAYRFRVQPGKYTIRLYFKIGYEPGAKPGNFVMNVDLEGKRVLDRFDLFLACGSDFNQPLVKEFRHIQVTDGTLDLEFSTPAGVDPSARLCNAIEVIKEQNSSVE